MEVTKRAHSGHYQIIASPVECEMLLADLKLVPGSKRSEAGDELIDELHENGFGEEEEIKGLDEDGDGIEDEILDEDEDEDMKS